MLSTNINCFLTLLDALIILALFKVHRCPTHTHTSFATVNTFTITSKKENKNKYSYSTFQEMNKKHIY